MYIWQRPWSRMLSILKRPVFRALVSGRQAIAHLPDRVDCVKNAHPASTSRFFSTSCTWWKKSGKQDPPPPGAKDDVSEEMKAAVQSVAEALPGDKSQTESDLLKQLRQHTGTTDSQSTEPTATKPASQMSSSLLKGMRVQSRRDREEQMEMKKQGPRLDRKGPMPGTEGGRQRQRLGEDPSSRPDFKLLEGKRLGIFSAPEALPPPTVEPQRPSTLWEKVHQEQLEQALTHPPTNAWEEMIQWTKEGKMWTFPINNEAGMEEEANIGFHEHVFLDHLLAQFPARGPIRHFMELVLVGLSKNPFLTVKEKHHHVEWFHRYFSEKQATLEESLGKEGIMPPVPKSAGLEKGAAS